MCNIMNIKLLQNKNDPVKYSYPRIFIHFLAEISQGYLPEWFQSIALIAKLPTQNSATFSSLTDLVSEN